MSATTTFKLNTGAEVPAIGEPLVRHSPTTDIHRPHRYWHMGRFHGRGANIRERFYPRGLESEYVSSILHACFVLSLLRRAIDVSIRLTYMVCNNPQVNPLCGRQTLWIM